MIKGCQRKIIYLKNTDSGIFDEAYFVLRRDKEAEAVGETDMVSEAKRIIDGAFVGGRTRKRKAPIWFFSMGALAATVLFSVLRAIFSLL